MQLKSFNSGDHTFRLTNGTKIETKVQPNIGPIQAPNKVPPALISEPKLLHRKANPVAIMPQNTDNNRKMIV